PFSVGPSSLQEPRLSLDVLLLLAAVVEERRVGELNLADRSDLAGHAAEAYLACAEPLPDGAVPVSRRSSLALRLQCGSPATQFTAPSTLSNALSIAFADVFPRRSVKLFPTCTPRPSKRPPACAHGTRATNASANVHFHIDFIAESSF